MPTTPPIGTIGKGVSFNNISARASILSPVRGAVMTMAEPLISKSILREYMETVQPSTKGKINTIIATIIFLW